MGRGIRGLLIDLDGVLYVGEKVIPGAKACLESLKTMGIRRRFVTNTTTRTRGEVVAKMGRLGFEIAEEEVLSAVSATRDFLKDRYGRNARVHLVVRESVRAEFREFQVDEDSPDVVVVGDIGAAWSYPLMNRIFRNLEGGANLVAMHKNKFFQTEEGLVLDIGAFVSGLEYVSGKQAEVVGKPSHAFFQMGLQSLELKAEEVAMVGDDIESDVGGGKAAGVQGILVKTGKYRAGCETTSGVKPDGVIESIAELPRWLAGE